MEEKSFALDLLRDYKKQNKRQIISLYGKSTRRFY